VGAVDSTSSIRIAEHGFRGARLGEPYIYRWVDQEPTQSTWTDLANRKGCLWVLLGLPAAWIGGLLFGGVGLFSIAVLASVHIVAMLHSIGYSRSERTDGEPVPKPVRREAYIEYSEGDFYFVLEDDGKARIWQRWELVRQFEKVDYWPMFGDAGASPYKTGWHAIVMTPLVGAPWMIGSTIEAEAAVRERFTELDARFSADTRARFLRAYEARKSASRQTSSPGVPPGADEPAARAKAKGVPDKL
jgi:hypothetical protein